MKMLIERCSLWPKVSGSVLVGGGRIERVSSDETQTVPSETIKLDAAGGTLLPGLIDSHCHPFEVGWLKRNVDLRGTTNLTALRMRVAARAQRFAPGEWVVGIGWDQEAFPDRRLPTRHDIDDLTPENPVVLGRVCGHIGLLNSRAIEALGMEDRTGEEYERDERGSLTGIIKERALVEAYSRLPGKSAANCMADLSAVEFDAAKLGLTTLHTIISADEYREETSALVSLATEGRLLLRHRAYIPPEAIDYVKEKDFGRKLLGTRARINGVKLYADGSLGARTAALREPYSDDPTNLGILRYSDEELTELASKADAAGYQVIVHAIGDRAAEQALGALSVVSGGGNPRRHRIEHASLFPKSLRAKARKLGVKVAVQPSFIVSDTWAESRLGPERVRDLYPLGSIFSEGIIASGSSDAPVESFSPVVGMWASMARAGTEMDEALKLEEAMALYTTNGAINGSDEFGPPLRYGAVANLTLMDSEIGDMHPALLRKVSVAATIVEGELVYSSFE